MSLEENNRTEIGDRLVFLESIPRYIAVKLALELRVDLRPVVSPREN